MNRLAQKVAFDEDEALALAERTFSTEIDEQLAEDIIQYASRLHSRYMQQSAPDVVTQILSLISDECRYWHGRDEARRGGYAILHAKAKELISKQQPTPEVAKLVEALEEMIDVAQRVDGWESFPSDPIERAEDAIQAYRKGTSHDN